MKCEEITTFTRNGKQYARTKYSERVGFRIEKTVEKLFKFKAGEIIEVNLWRWDIKECVKIWWNNALRATNKRKLLIILLALLFGCSGGLNSISVVPDLFSFEEDIEICKIRRLDKLYNDTLSLESVRWWAKRYEVKFVDVFIEQVLHETGWLTSAICIENNNLCGMKLARSRETTAKGERGGHAYYSDFKDSIKDYKLWQEYYSERINQCISVGEYRRLLKRLGYAEDERYISLLIRTGKNI